MISLRRPPPIRTDGSNAFASHTMRVRVPKILAQAAAQQQHAADATALRALREEVLADARIRPLGAPAPDLDEWQRALTEHGLETWFTTTWFFAETYVYRRVIEAVRFFETDRDPFRVTKEEELVRPATWEFVRDARATQAAGPDEKVMRLLGAALWGNRMDLSYAAAAAHGTANATEDLLHDDRARVLPALLRRGAKVAVVADNAGTELLVDLVLAECLLSTGAAQITLHVKAHPTFVSDAIGADVRDGIERLGGPIAAAFADGRVRLAPDTYWNSPYFIDEAPRHVVRSLAGADLAIVKGDANYRRLVGDAVWDPTTPLDAATGALPCPMLALRTLKSDPLVGLSPGVAEALDRSSPTWRVDGRRGVAQLFPGGTSAQSASG